MLLDVLKMRRLDMARGRMTVGRWFWKHVDRGHPMDCWAWLGPKTPPGYGYIKLGHRNIYAHRIAFEVSGGTLIPGMVIMHLCDHPPCCNPAHLKQATQGDNIRDSISKGRFYQIHKPLATHCKHGHEFSAQNTYISKGRRTCRICGNQRAKEYQARKKAKLDTIC